MNSLNKSIKITRLMHKDKYKDIKNSSQTDQNRSNRFCLITQDKIQEFRTIRIPKNILHPLIKRFNSIKKVQILKYRTSEAKLSKN
jgi:hypothetical protein